jgi:phosphoglucosamine mutase
MRMGAINQPRFGTDGVRGVAGTELTTAFVRLLGRAAARVLNSPTILVGRDPRPSSPEFALAFAQGVAAEGVNVVDVGMLPTPALAWLASERGVAAAMITASHNPHTDNGVKVFAVGGHKLADDVEAAIEQQLTALGDDAAATVAGPGVAGSISADDAAVGHYVSHMVSSFPAAMLEGVHLVVDCANGAMSNAAPEVLRRLGAQLTVLNADPRGTNINDGCGATHPDVVLAAVREHGVDAGLAFDGDGDRVMGATASGVIDGDRLIAVVAPWMKAHGTLRGDAVAVTVMSNLGLRIALREAGVRIAETAVGDRYVLEALDREGLVLGGEQSGHIILRDRATTGDGLLAGLVLLEAAQQSGASLDALAAGAMVQFPQVLVNVRVARRDPAVAQLVADEIAATEAALAGQGRVLVRPSGTEPLVRVMVEAATEAQARHEAERLAAVIAERLS